MEASPPTSQLQCPSQEENKAAWQVKLVQKRQGGKPDPKKPKMDDTILTGHFAHTPSSQQEHSDQPIGSQEVRTMEQVTEGQDATTTRMEGETVGDGEIPNSACVTLRKANPTKSMQQGKSKPASKLARKDPPTIGVMFVDQTMGGVLSKRTAWLR